MTRKFAFRVAYLGKNYCGWQRQSKGGPESPVLPAIQEILEDALSRITNERIVIIGSGRTDAGVNSVGQVAHFRTHNMKITSENLKRGMNTYLPSDIRVMKVDLVADEFHAQRSALKKQYSYFFQQGPSPLPHLMDHTWWIYRELDVEAMQSAVKHLIGQHDFKAFQASDANPLKSTIREILEAEVTHEKLPSFPGGDLNEEGYSVIRVRLVGTGFLKQMVRGIAGTLLKVGEGRKKPEEMIEIIEKKDRGLVGSTAPPKGLTLERVWYSLDGSYGNTN
jgi:tRNA pseudouridine38-40 synthase